MKRFLRLALLFSWIFTISYAYSAQLPPVTNITKGLADSAKNSLLGPKEKFPVKVEGGYEVANIFSYLNYVIFEYNMPTDSQSMSISDFSENIRQGLSDQFCDKPDVIDALRLYDIRFLFRFKFTDNRNIPSTLSIDEICDNK